MKLVNKALKTIKVQCILEIKGNKNECKYVTLCASLLEGIYVEYGIDEFGKVICVELTDYTNLQELLEHWEKEYGKYRVGDYRITRGI